MTALLDAALGYAKRGWYVFPVQCAIPGDKESGKAPATHLVHNGKDNATTDESVIRWWWSQGDWNIGINTPRSGLVVLDVDVGTNKDGTPKGGRESLAKINDQLPNTLTAQTGGGGIHAIYQRPIDFVPVQKIGFDSGLDLISNGYIVASPSRHHSGGVYTWTNEGTPLVDLPVVLRDVQRASKKVTSSSEVGAPITEGSRNNALYKLGAALRATGISYDSLLAALLLENEKRFVPPLPEAEVVLIAGSAMHAKVTRDVAAGTMIADELAAMLGVVEPEQIAEWAENVAGKKVQPVRVYSTGNPELDKLLGGGMSTTQVFGVIGPPSTGKSAYVGSLCLNVHDKVPVLHVSTELTRRELMVRYAASIKGFPWRDGMRGSVSTEDLQAACRGLNVKMIGSDQLDLIDPIGMIVTEACTIRDERGVSPLIVIDYVQLLARGTEDGTRARVGELTKKIRIMAQLLDCVVIAVFSTGRGFYGGDKLERLREMNDPLVYLGAAKESGDIEFDCATIVFLDVDQNVEGSTKPASVAVARCRVGDIGFAGYRAELAVGRWVPDPGSRLTMAGPERAKRKQIAEQETENQIFLKAVAENPHATWTYFRNTILLGSGIGHSKAPIVLARLQMAGRVEQVVEFDESMRKREVLRVTNKPAGTIVTSSEVTQ